VDTICFANNSWVIAPVYATQKTVETMAHTHTRDVVLQHTDAMPIIGFNEVRIVAETTEYMC